MRMPRRMETRQLMEQRRQEILLPIHLRMAPRQPHLHNLLPLNLAREADP